MTLQKGLLLCLVLMLISAAIGAERGHREGSQTHGNTSRINIPNRRLSCHSNGGQCTKPRDTCPIWLPLETTPGKPYCQKRQRCCYRDSCPNPIFEAFHVCAKCSSSEDALDFVKELWGQPSTNPRNTTVLNGHNITYTHSTWNNQLACESSLVVSWDCFQNETGYWTDCRRTNGPGICTFHSSLNNGHLLSQGLCLDHIGVIKDDRCDCSYRKEGGCIITEKALVNTACECKYIGGYTCSGGLTVCSDKTSPYCTSPDTSMWSCLQGGGDCQGYKEYYDDCDCDYHKGGCCIHKAAPANKGAACQCRMNGALTCKGRVVGCRDPTSATCKGPGGDKWSCWEAVGDRDCGGYPKC